MNFNDKALIKSGDDKINWVKDFMPVLSSIGKDFEKNKPFSGMKIATSIHLEAKTAYLLHVLRMGGAEISATGCNPLSTQNDIVASLKNDGFCVNAEHGISDEEYKNHLIQTLSVEPDLIIDDGGDFIELLHGEASHLGKNLIGGCEETTTGIHRLRQRQKNGTLNYTMFNINDADSKHLFDNRYGTGQSTLDAIMHCTNLIIAGKTAVVAGYGWCGKGIAKRLLGMGANVIVTEIDPIAAMEAVMDGFRVMPMDKAAELGDLFITATGCSDVITEKHFNLMKNNVLLANSGHFDVEIDKKYLDKAAINSVERKPCITGYTMPDGKIINLLAQGRLVNLAAGNGHPAEIMDISFALQARCLEYLAKHGKTMENKLYSVPTEIDKKVMAEKLAMINVKYDTLSDAQREYLGI